LRWRKEHPALVSGAIRFLQTPEPLLALARGAGAGEVLAIFNLSSETCELATHELARFRQIESAGVREGRLEGARVQIPALCVVFAAV
jgi:alpha-glucosidase